MMRYTDTLLLSAATAVMFTSISTAIAAPAATKHTRLPIAKPAIVKKESKRVKSKDEEIAVLGRRASRAGGGMMAHITDAKSVSSVSRVFIARQSPTSTVLQLISAVPGVNFAAVDPLSISDQSDMSSRGVDQPEIGYIYEDVPLNFSLTGNPNTTAWADSENLDQVSFSQGASDIQDPTYTEVGGLLRSGLRTPSDTFGGRIDASYGSFQSNRQFVRIDSGYIGHTGVKAFISFSNLTAKNWRGAGRNDKQHVDFKMYKSWAPNSHTSLAVTYNNLRKTTYIQPTLAQWNALGRNYNYPATYTPGATNFYRNYINDWQAIIVSMPTHPHHPSVSSGGP